MDWGVLLGGLALLVTAANPVMLAIINRNQQAAATKRDAAATVAATKVEAVRVAADATATKVEAVRADLRTQGEATAGKLDTIHDAVNSNYADLLRKLAASDDLAKSLTAQVLALTGDKSRLEAEKHASDVATALRTPVATHTADAPMPVIVVQPPGEPVPVSNVDRP